MDGHVDELFSCEARISGNSSPISRDLGHYNSAHDEALFSEYFLIPVDDQTRGGPVLADGADTKMLLSPRTSVPQPFNIDPALSYACTSGPPTSTNTQGLSPNVSISTASLNADSSPTVSTNPQGGVRRARLYPCGVDGCRQKFTEQSRRLTHARAAHRGRYFCTCSGCHSMQNHEVFLSRQLLDEHWLSSHPAVNHYRCLKCFYSTGNSKHMHRHLSKHFRTEEAVDEEMDRIRIEKTERQGNIVVGRNIE